MQNNIPKDAVKNKYFSNLPYLGQERTQKFLGIILTLFALSFFGFFAINPTISTILKLKKELADSQFVFDQLDVKIKNLSTLRGMYFDLQNDLPVVINAIPTQPDAQILFAQIQTAAQQSNIKIKKLQNFQVEVLKNNKGLGKPYYSYSFSISGTGSSESVYSFTSAITNMQRVLSIDVFSMNNTSGQDTQSLGFNIQGSAYFKE